MQASVGAQVFYDGADDWCMAGISSISAATLDPTVVAAAAELNLASEQAALSAADSELASGILGGTLDVVG